MKKFDLRAKQIHLAAIRAQVSCVCGEKQYLAGTRTKLTIKFAWGSALSAGNLLMSQRESGRASLTGRELLKALQLLGIRISCLCEAFCRISQLPFDGFLSLPS